MPIADIIKEIDAYLLCLRDARDVLLASTTGPRREKAPLQKKKIKAKKPAAVVSSRQRTQRNKFRPNSLALQEKTVETDIDAFSPVGNSVARPDAIPEQSSIAATALPPQRRIERNANSSDERRHRPISTPRNTSPSTRGTKQEKIKPVTALTDSMSSKVVVLSAEEARRERERGMNAEVRPRPLRATGLSGRQAFEALFRD